MKDQDGKALPGAKVHINGAELSSLTDSQGSVTSIESYNIGDSVTVKATLDGYYPGTGNREIIAKNGDNPNEVNIMLEKLPGSSLRNRTK